MRERVSENLDLSSSSASSVSCEFWIRKRLDSSSAVKMSSSCCGSWKYIGTSASSSAPSASEMSSRESCGGPVVSALAASASSASLSLRVRRPRLARSASCSASLAASATANASFTSACLTLSFASFASCFRFDRSARCSSNHSGGVSLSRKAWYLRQSSSCSSNLDISDLIWVICAFSFLISCTFSALAFVSASAFLIACTAFWSLSLRNWSKRSASSSSICSLFRSASSRCCARSSSLRISARFVSSDICTRNISRFLAMKSAMFSFSFRRSRVAAATRLSRFSAGASTLWSFAGALLLTPFSHTCSSRARSRSCFLRCCSSSRSANTSSSVGIRNGLEPDMAAGRGA
mmetsp:Transcript_4612/g.7656  ORF Transcript_4612/g.7656 Transcript_4612/m.7656 type:complete len:350 (+) Transcript_4612:912-1961(+)